MIDEKLKNIEHVYIAVGVDLSLGSIYDKQIKEKVRERKMEKSMIQCFSFRRT